MKTAENTQVALEICLPGSLIFQLKTWILRPFVPVQLRGFPQVLIISFLSSESYCNNFPSEVNFHYDEFPFAIREKETDYQGQSSFFHSPTVVLCLGEVLDPPFIPSP